MDNIREERDNWNEQVIFTGDEMAVYTQPVIAEK
jgi:hypothetical protein